MLLSNPSAIKQRKASEMCEQGLEQQTIPLSRKRLLTGVAQPLDLYSKVFPITHLVTNC